MAVGHPIIVFFLAISGIVAFGSSFDTGTTAEDPEPQFVGVIPNITAVAGADVTLPCVVESLGDYKVAWIHMNRHILLTINFRVITRNPRISISYDRDRTWSLHIRNVTEYDSGRYLCQVNTSPMKDSMGILEVIVPPIIRMPETVVKAIIGTNVTLDCEVESNPKSVTYWTRDDRGIIIISDNKYNSVLTNTDEHKVRMRLIIKNLCADDFGSYRCVARNKAGETEGTITIYDPTSYYPSREGLPSSAAAIDGRGRLMWTTILIKIVFHIIFSL